MEASTKHTSLSVQTPTGVVTLDYIAGKKAAMILRAVNQKLRQQIIKYLDENKGKNVTDIYIKMRLEQSVASQHLAILRRERIVTAERRGKEIFYTVNYQQIAKIAGSVTDLVHDSGSEK